MKKIIFLLVLTIFLVGCTKKGPLPVDTNVIVPSITQPIANDTQDTVDSLADDQYKKLCDWVDKSDIIIKINFADGVVKDGSYETGFYLSSIKSTMRLARSGCDYRTGFSYEELKNLGAVQVGVRGYTDRLRRQIVNEPINVVFNESGVPDIGSYIEVTITD
jgi:hypothetical protein